jgi:hypothetical protein
MFRPHGLRCKSEWNSERNGVSPKMDKSWNLQPTKPHLNYLLFFSPPTWWWWDEKSVAELMPFKTTIAYYSSLYYRNRHLIQQFDLAYRRSIPRLSTIFARLYCTQLFL